MIYFRFFSLFSGALKDAGGPSINVLTKLICVVSIVNVSKNNWYDGSSETTSSLDEG